MTRTVRASGTGEATAVPDAAVVRLAVTHRAGDLADALAGAESARAEVVAAAHAHVAAGQVASTGLSVWPDHDDAGRPDGYRARHGLRIRCPGTQEAGALLAALSGTAGGRLEVESVALEVSDLATALDVARERAFEQARSRAAHLAVLAGAGLGPVRHVAEGGAAAGTAWARESLKASGVGLEPGESSVSTTVTVEFELV